MANTLTNLTPDIYAALDIVSRELVGFIPAVTRDSTADRVASGQNLRIPVSPANAAGATITPAMSLPSAADQTIANAALTITKQRYFPFSWTGEEQKAMDYGPTFQSLKQYQIAQAIRAAVNEVETDVAVAAQLGASRAYGTAGTTPFASNLTELANVRKILADNGAPPTDRQMVLGTTASTNLRGLTNLYKVNESGEADMLRQGTLSNLFGFEVRESAQVQNITKGTGTLYTSSTAGFAVGTTSIPVITGSGTILAGDVITFAGDTNKYVVATGVAAPGTIVLAAPGLRQALAASAVALTIGNNYAANMAFTRNSILLATRLPAVPVEGLARNVEIITDPRTGISLRLAEFPNYSRVQYEVSAAWGWMATKPEHIAVSVG